MHSSAGRLFMLNVSYAKIKERSRIPAEDINSDGFIKSISEQSIAVCEGLLNSLLTDFTFSEVFPLDKGLLYGNLQNNRYPLRLKNGFVSDVKVEIYKPADLVTPVIYEVDYEAGMVYIDETTVIEGVKEVQISYKTGDYNYPQWLEQLFLLVVEYNSNLPNLNAEGTGDSKADISKAITTILKNNRRKSGNSITSIFINSARL